MTPRSAERMRTFRPNGAYLRAPMITECNRRWERSRLDWRIGDPGDPAALADRFPVRRTGSDCPWPGRLARRSAIAMTSTSAARRSSSRPRRGAVADRRADRARRARPPPCPDLVAVVYAPRPRVLLVPIGRRPSALRLARRRVAGRAVGAQLDPGRARRRGGTGARGHRPRRRLPGQRGRPRPRRRTPATRCRRCAGSPRLPGARYPAVLTGDGWAIACASPETLVRVAGRPWWRPGRSRAPARPPPPGRRELLASAKERAEHIMIVDLERNDLARVARIGVGRRTRAVRGPALVRPVAGRVPGGGPAAPTTSTWPSCCAPSCPGGSVTGAPKLAALAQIAALEPVGRGPSMGALGWLDADRLDLGLTIRTVAVDAESAAPVGRRRHHLGLRPRRRGRRGRRQGRPAPRRPRPRPRPSHPPPSHPTPSHLTPSRLTPSRLVGATGSPRLSPARLTGAAAGPVLAPHLHHQDRCLGDRSHVQCDSGRPSADHDRPGAGPAGWRGSRASGRASAAPHTVLRGLACATMPTMIGARRTNVESHCAFVRRRPIWPAGSAPGRAKIGVSATRSAVWRTSA